VTNRTWKNGNESGVDRSVSPDSDAAERSVVTVIVDAVNPLSGEPADSGTESPAEHRERGQVDLRVAVRVGVPQTSCRPRRGVRHTLTEFPARTPALSNCLAASEEGSTPEWRTEDGQGPIGWLLRARSCFSRCCRHGPDERDLGY
jgi:hypothetical protein